MEKLKKKEDFKDHSDCDSVICAGGCGVVFSNMHFPYIYIKWLYDETA